MTTFMDFRHRHLPNGWCFDEDHTIERVLLRRQLGAPWWRVNELDWNMAPGCIKKRIEKLQVYEAKKLVELTTFGDEPLFKFQEPLNYIASCADAISKMQIDEFFGDGI